MVVSKNSKKTLSIVMPVYNAERDLYGILDGILACHLRNMEVICVDDGSSDKSAEIIDEYQKKDYRFHVIHQDNQGLSRAVNRGINESLGQYLWIIDDDDKIEPGVLDTFPVALKDRPDIITFGYTIDFVEEGYSIERVLPDKEYLNTLDALHDYFGNESFNPHWNKIYKRECIENISQEMNTNDQAGDFVMNCLAFPKADKIINSSSILYHYEKRSNETMVTRYLKNGEEALQTKETALRTMMNAINANNDPLIDNYMLKEYEVFVINLVNKNCPYSENKKIELIQKNILNEKAYRSIQRAIPTGVYSRIFRNTALKNDAGKLLRTYEHLNYIKNQFGPLYRRFRQHSYMKGNKS